MPYKWPADSPPQPFCIAIKFKICIQEKVSNEKNPLANLVLKEDEYVLYFINLYQPTFDSCFLTTQYPFEPKTEDKYVFKG